jgi:hypothetical protein
VYEDVAVYGSIAVLDGLINVSIPVRVVALAVKRNPLAVLGFVSGGITDLGRYS